MKLGLDKIFFFLLRDRQYWHWRFSCFSGMLSIELSWSSVAFDWNNTRTHCSESNLKKVWQAMCCAVLCSVVARHQDKHLTPWFSTMPPKPGMFSSYTVVIIRISSSRGSVPLLFHFLSQSHPLSPCLLLQSSLTCKLPWLTNTEWSSQDVFVAGSEV